MTTSNGNGNLIDEFEEAFQHCLGLFTMKDDKLSSSGIGLTIDKEESKLEAEQITLRFIDLARQVEAFFLQKRFLLSAIKPELVMKEDMCDLKVELVRKDELLKKHYDKISVWQNLLSEMHGWVQPNGLPNNLNIQNQSTSNGSTSISQQQLLQHQQQMQQMQQHQIQQQLHQQQTQQGSGSSSTAVLQGVNVAVAGQQGMFMNQNNAAVASRQPGFPVAGVANSALQGPLAFLEKTTSNIGMPERRS